MQSISRETNKSSAKNLQHLATSTFSTPQIHKALNMVTPSTGSTIDESDTEEVVVEGVAAGVAAIPLNIPGSSFTPTLHPIVSGVKSSGDLSGASSDSADSEAKKLRKKSLPYYESVGRSFRILAEERGWRNADNSIFPISVTNLCNYVRVKKDTNNSKSVDWYIAALKKYQELVLNVKDWDEVRKHPEVKRLMSQIKVEGNSKIGGDSSPLAPSGKDKGKGNGERSIIEINKNNSEFPHSNKVNPQFGSYSNLSLQTFSSTNKFPGPAETALALLGPFMVDDDSIGRKDSILSKKLVDETLDFDTPNYEPSTSKFTSRLVDPMVISASDDDEDYVPPKKSSRGYIPDRKRRRKRLLDSESHSDDDEPESFKSRYENSLSVLKSKYVDSCKNHPNGCYPVKTGKHFVLNDRLFRRWASLCASGDDVNEDSLPYSDELEKDFSELKANPI
ncbi:7120_t:CDS:2 [Funneliformis mosseae]|uniref:7120_t:CDS:1 n=1 Tax=Funneliformis mosseae TaxID=27381 RepID=A0A9N9D1F9_FUNMO|nr:7120_t:CDS:2 [Funneliformis mosseae]